MSEPQTQTQQQGNQSQGANQAQGNGQPPAPTPDKASGENGKLKEAVSGMFMVKNEVQRINQISNLVLSAVMQNPQLERFARGDVLEISRKVDGMPIGKYLATRCWQLAEQIAEAQTELATAAVDRLTAEMLEKTEDAEEAGEQ